MKNKILNSIKNITIILTSILLILFIILIYWSNDFNRWKIHNIKDEYLLKDFSKINDSINNKPEVLFNNLEEFNSKFNLKINPVWFWCYYVNNKSDIFIFAAKLNWKEMIEKYDNWIYIYKSLDNYNINDTELSNIKDTINKPCN